MFKKEVRVLEEGPEMGVEANIIIIVLLIDIDVRRSSTTKEQVRIGTCTCIVKKKRRGRSLRDGIGVEGISVDASLVPYRVKTYSLKRESILQ